MRKVEIVRPGPSDPTEPGARRRAVESTARPSERPIRVTGRVHRRAASPPDASIWLDVLELADGAALAWSSEHGEEAVFVERGAVAQGDRICPAGGVLVLEAGARVELVARAETRLLHMGAQERDHANVEAGARGAASTSLRAPSGSTPVVHVVGPRGVSEAIEPGRETRFFADATCPGCGVWLLYTARSFAYASPVHSHSQDELIHVLSGEIRLGSLVAGPGSTLFIAADQPYRFQAGEAGFAFLNFRRAASVMTIRPSGERIVENGRATGMTAVAEANV